MGVVWLGSSEINPELGHFTGVIAEALSHWLSQARTSARKDAAFHMGQSFLVGMPAVRQGVWMNDNFYATSDVSYRCGLSLDMLHIPWPFYLSLCWTYSWAQQKWIYQLRWCLVAHLWGPKQRHIWWRCTLAPLIQSNNLCGSDAAYHSHYCINLFNLQFTYLQFTFVFQAAV